MLRYGTKALAFLFLTAPGLLAAKPAVNFKLQVFVDPAGVMSRNVSPSQLEKNKDIILKRMIKDFQEDGFTLSNSYRLDINRGQFFRYFTHEENGSLHLENDTMVSKAQYTLDLVVGEDQNGLLAGVWLINNETGAIYRKNKVTIKKKNIRYVIQALIQTVDELHKKFTKSRIRKLGDTETISQVIARTETPVEMEVEPSTDTASMSLDRTVTINVSRVLNVYDRPVYDYLGENMRLACKLVPNTPGNIVSGEPIEGSQWRWDHVKDGRAHFLYKLPKPDAFKGGQNPLKVEFKLAGVDYLTQKVMESSEPVLVGPTEFYVRADYAWHVVSTWKFRSKNLSMDFNFEYDLHKYNNCKDYLVDDFFYSAMSVKQAWWYSDNFVRMKYEPLKNKGQISNFKYTDCGLLDPWKLSDASVDTIYVVGFPVGDASDPSKVQLINFCFFFGGASATNAVDDAVDVFDLFNARVIGERIHKGFGDIPAKISWMIDMNSQKLNAFQPFTDTYSASYEFVNYNCETERVEVSITQKFTPVYEFSCIATREEEENK